MDGEFWRERWKLGQLGFHLAEVNPNLVAHAEALPAGARVLVPLCGKSVDLAWLAARGHDVVGVELVEEALRAFCREQGLTPAVRTDPRVTTLEAGPITLLAADFFALAPADVGRVGAAYDRAALVAMPPALRPAYAAQLRRLAAGATLLLVTFDHDLPGGPPFAVPDDEVRALFDGAPVTLLGTRDALASSPNLAARGATRLVERAYRIQL